MLLIVPLTLLISVWSSSVSTLPSSSSSTQKKKVILILADGVRYDYVKDPNLKGFHKLRKNGVEAEYVQPIFPANSYPNWYTIVTGLYAESHGMVQNFMFDPTVNETFLMNPHPNASHSHWWNQAEPIWVSAEKQGVPTAVFWWDGCQVAIRNTTPTYCADYQSYWTWPKPKEDTLEAMHEILDKFETDEWQLALVYYEAVDAIGHAWGPESEERLEAVKDLDEIMDTLHSEIQRRNLDNQVNVVLVSDHGMITVDRDNNKTIIIDIEEILDENDVQVMLDRGSTSFLIPKNGKEGKILEDLKKGNRTGLRFYARNDLPTKYHIKNNLRTAPIVLVAEKGYFVTGFSQNRKTKPVWDVLYTGHHGYDPYKVDQMRTIMFGIGPDFKSNYVSPPLMMTDHYNLVCYLLGIQAQANNGTWLRVQDMIAPSSERIHIYKYLNSSSFLNATINQSLTVAIILAIFSFNHF